MLKSLRQSKSELEGRPAGAPEQHAQPKEAKKNPFGGRSQAVATEQTNPMDDGIEEDIVDHEEIALQEVDTGLMASESAISASA